jgi:hypothetical protein
VHDKRVPTLYLYIHQQSWLMPAAAHRCFPVSQVTHHHALFEPHHHHWEAAHEFMQKYFCQVCLSW